MSNKQSKGKQKTVRKNGILSIWLKHILLFIIGSFWIYIPIHTYAFSINTALGELYNSAKYHKSLHSFPKSRENGNIFKLLYQNNQRNNSQVFQESIDATYNFIKNETCRINKSDIQEVLFQTNTIYRTQVQGNIQEQLTNANIRDGKQENNLNKACMKISTCFHQEQKEQFGLSELTQCIQKVNDIYGQQRSVSLAHTQIEQINEGDQRYENGTLRDSSFDLLVDIQNIGDILFANNKQVPELLFYQTPSRDALPKNEGRDTDNKTNNISQHQERERMLPQSNNFFNHTPIYTRQKDNRNNGSTKNIIDNITTSTPRDIHSNTITNTIFGVNICDTGSQQNQTGKQDIQPTWEEYTQARNDYENTLEPFDNRINDYILGKQSTHTGSNDNESPKKSKQTPPQDEEKLIQSCRNKCKNLSVTDQILCMAECLCEVWPDTEAERTKDLLTYQIRFCMIPSKATSNVITNKKIMSIEEIIDEINTVLYNLERSGELGKSNHTTEFFDSSLENIKLPDLIAFNITLAFKPIFNTLPDLVIQRKQKERDKNNQNAIFDINRNKYIITADSVGEFIGREKNIETENYEQEYNKLRQLNRTTKTQKSNEDFDAKNQNFATTEKIIKDFIFDNIQFRKQANQIMDNVQKISLSLKNKIEQK